MIRAWTFNGRVIGICWRNFGASLRRRLRSGTLDTVGTRSARDPLRFPPDLDLDLDLVYEIFKVKVKTLTSFFSVTNCPTTSPFDPDVVLDDPYRSPEGQGRDPHRGARNPLEILIFKRHFLGHGKLDFFLCRVCSCTSGPLPNGNFP